MQNNLLTQALFHFVELLEKHRIPYALIGGIAVTIIARERFTNDVDFTIAINQKKAKELEDLFRHDPQYQVHLIQFLSSDKIPDFFRIFHGTTAIDLLVANTSFQKEVVKRATAYPIEGRTLRVATPEDLVILKLLADRPRDREDITAIRQAHPQLNWDYLKRWAKVWEIEDRLQAIYAERLERP